MASGSGPTPDDVKKQHLFLNAAKDFEWKKVREMVLAEPTLINAQPQKHGGQLRWSALHQAAENGAEAEVKWLLEHGADPTLSAEGKTPKDVAASDQIKSILDKWMVPEDKSPDEDLVMELAGRLQLTANELQEPHILPDFQKFDEVTADVLTMEGLDQANGMVFMELSKLVGCKKGAALFRKLTQILTTAILAGRAAPFGMRLFIDFEDFSVARKVQLNMTNPFFVCTVSHQSEKFFKRYNISTGGVDTSGLPEASIVKVPQVGGGLVVTNLPGKPWEQNTFFQRICESLGPQYPRFCIDLLQAPNAFKNAKFFTMMPGMSPRELNLTDGEKDDVVDTVGLFHAECLHATIHVFHYLLIGLLEQASQKCAELKLLLKLYSPNVNMKHNQVQNLLLSSEDQKPVGPGTLVGRSFVSDRDLLRRVLSDFLAELGACHSAEEVMELFYPQIMNDTLSQLLRLDTKPPEFPEPNMPPPGLPAALGDLQKQADLVPQFSQELAAVFDKDGQASRAFQEVAGKKSLAAGRFRITSLKQWLELISISGLIHGTTLSMTRMFFTPQGLSYSNIGRLEKMEDFKPPARFGEDFSKHDFEITAVAYATITGLQDHREVFPDVGKIQPPIVSRSQSEQLTALKKICKDAHDKSTSIKEKTLKYYQDVLGEEFAARGWMFSDYYPSGLLNQATLTTYL